MGNEREGVIIAILDSTGNVVVRYKYDAWGNHKVLDASDSVITDASHIGNLNSFRYRSYYFDTETKLYFLKTRYYDPEVGRFINMDSIDYADPEKINGLNLYAYCNNNPVMNVDPEGTWSWGSFFKIIGAALVVVAATALAVATAGTAIGVIAAGAAIGATVGTVVGGAGSAINAAVNGASGEEIFDAFADGALSGSIVGAASGALAASGYGIGVQIGGNALISGLEYTVTSTISGEFNYMDFGISLGVGALAGYVGGPGVMNYKNHALSTILRKQLIRSSTKVITDVTGPILRGGIAGLLGSIIKNII